MKVASMLKIKIYMGLVASALVMWLWAWPSGKEMIARIQIRPLMPANTIFIHGAVRDNKVGTLSRTPDGRMFFRESGTVILEQVQ